MNKQQMSKRIGLALTAAVAGVALGFAPPAEPTFVVAVWDAAGNPLDGAAVTALNGNGGVKGVAQGQGIYLLDQAGFQIDDYVKATVEVQHPIHGADAVDVLLSVAPTVRLELVYTGFSVVDAYSPQSLPEPTPPGDGVPVNDECSGALAAEVGVVTSGSTLGAGVDDDNDQCGTSITAPGVWYSVTGTGNTMTATTCTSFFGYDTKVTVFCGDCDDLNCLGGNDDSCATGASGLLSTVSWCSQSGATYYVLVHGFSTGAGPFELLVDDDGVPCSGAFPCAAAGACCFADGSCDQLTAADCAAAGGNYSGDGVACFDILGSNSYGSNPNVPIPDFDVNGVSDSLVVGDSFAIGDLDLNISVSHTWQGDLIVTLRHEDTGTEVVAIDRIGVPAGTFGCGEDNWVNVVIDDEGDAPIENVCTANLTSPPNWIGTEALSAFDGEDAAGTWTLTISDNAEFDTGSLLSWGITAAEAGNPVCPPAECFLVIGDQPGADTFVGADHEFTTLVDAIAESHAVLMGSIPSFELPPLTRGLPAVGQFGPVGGQPFSNLPEWMADGHFAVQVLMWNPVVFPGLPEQFTAGLDVELLSNGQLKATPYGDDLGGLTLEMQIDVLPDGTRVVSFPFQIPGF